MADKKKMSVAEVLAAARKADSAGSAAEEDAGPGPAEAPPEGAVTEEAAPAPSAPAKAKSPAPASAPQASGGKMSVADILAAARAQDKSGGESAAAKASPKPPAKKPPTSKPAAKSGPAKSADKPAAKPAAGPKDTASILAAARKSGKLGPMSKAEAKKQLEPDKASPDAKKKPEAPPMPVKPAYAKPEPRAAKPKASSPESEERRGFLVAGFASLGAVAVLWSLALARFMYPNVLREPPSQFKVGFPGDFAPGMVETKYKAQFGVWVVNTVYNGEQQLFALKSVCTHLGCTPNWLEAEQKFKCPCHGSGFYKDGINFEGPAPRPLERYAISVADDGQVQIDKSRIFQEEMGQWGDGSSYIPA